MQTLLRKWWVILLQGILLILIGFYFFGRPMEVLAALSIWVGFLTVLTGGAGLVGYFMMDSDERESGNLLWSFLTLLLGIFMLAKLGITMKTLTILVGIWILYTGYILAREGWALREEGFIGWATLIIGILLLVAGVSVIFNLHSGAIWISTLMGIEAILAGIAFIMLALVKRRVVNKVKDTAAELRQRLQ